ERTKGGIIIPDTAKEKPQEGRVVAVGPGKQEDGKGIKPDVKAGGRILFSKYAATEIKLDDEEHTIMREAHILGVIEASFATSLPYPEQTRKEFQTWLRRS